MISTSLRFTSVLVENATVKMTILMNQSWPQEPPKSINRNMPLTVKSVPKKIEQAKKSIKYVADYTSWTRKKHDAQSGSIRNYHIPKEDTGRFLDSL